MNTEYLIETLNSLSPLSSALEDTVNHFITEETFKYKTIISSTNYSGDRLYFIKKGIIKFEYTDTDNRNHILNFKVKGEFIISGFNSSTHQLLRKDIVLVTDCVLQSISLRQLRLLYVNFPECNLIGRLLMEKELIDIENRSKLLRATTARQRYDEFLKMHPRIFLTVPLKQISTYLGISPETLSRVRNR